MIPQVKQILSRIEEIHERKNQDYAQEDNKFSNFERAAIISSWFSDPVDKVFATMIGIKLARLAELKNGKVPKNESVDDTFLDQSTYSILWMAYYEVVQLGIKPGEWVTVEELNRLNKLHENMRNTMPSHQDRVRQNNCDHEWIILLEENAYNNGLRKCNKCSLTESSETKFTGKSAPPPQKQQE